MVRLGGDEFAIIISHLDHAHQASTLAQRVIDAVGQPLDLGGVLVTVGVSIGIALAPTNGDAPEVLFKNADLALYRAKAAARNSYCFYEAGMDAAVETRMQLELEMREAVMCGGFALHYQPVLRLADHKLVGFEALMRWPHPTRGMIAPDAFIPLAEETGLIVPLGSWALHEACREAASWPEDRESCRQRLGRTVPAAWVGRERPVGPCCFGARAASARAGDHRERACPRR